jgi:integrase
MDDIEWIIGQGDYANAAAAIQTSRENLSDPGSMILQWHIARLTRARQGKGAARINEKAYFRVGRLLLAHSMGVTFLKMTVRDFEELYGLVLDGQYDLLVVSEYSLVIEKFHAYLKNNFTNIPNVKFEDIECFCPRGHSVNANIIGPKSYHNVKNALWKIHEKGDRIGWIRYLMVVIAYRLSLRKMEIARVRIADINFTATHGYINVVNTEHGTPKSISGWRRIPMHELLTEDEFGALREWHTLRCAENNSPEALLFAEAAHKTGLISEYKTFDNILKVMRNITGDSELKFHSLRHSFATLLLLRFEANRLPGLLGNELDIFSAEYADAILPARFKHLNDGTRSTRKFLYELANMIGHSSPSMTLLHYIHCCDWILYHYLKKRLPKFDKKQLGQLLGLKKSQLYAKLKQSNLGVIRREYGLEECLVAGVVSPKLLDSEW